MTRVLAHLALREPASPASTPSFRKCTSSANGRIARVVRDEQDGLTEAIARRAQELHDLAAGARREIPRRLVRHHDARAVHDRARDRGALHLATRELVRHGAQLVRQAQELDHLPEVRVVGRARAALHHQGQLDVLRPPRGSGSG
jgi:hypothetical protein